MSSPFEASFIIKIYTIVSYIIIVNLLIINKGWSKRLKSISFGSSFKMLQIFWTPFICFLGCDTLYILLLSVTIIQTIIV